MPWGLLVPLTVSAVALGSVFGALEVATVAFSDDAGHKALSGLLLGRLLARQPDRRCRRRHLRLEERSAAGAARSGWRLLAVGSVSLPFLPGCPCVTAALFLTGLALAPTLIALFSLIESAVPRSRLNEAMGFVQTGVGRRHRAGRVAGRGRGGRHGGSAAYWVCTVSRRARPPWPVSRSATPRAAEAGLRADG